MKTVAGLISIIIIFSFVLTTSVIAIVPVLKGIPPKEYADHLTTYWGMYSGVIGVIIGYYFGKKTEA